MPRGVRELHAEVLEKNLCAGCGMCVGMCPYLKTIEEKVAVVHPCGLEEGNCYLACPRGLTDLLWGKRLASILKPSRWGWRQPGRWS